MAKKKWYETYDEKTLLMAGLLLLLPLGAVLIYFNYTVIVGIPFIIMGTASTLLGLYLWLTKVLGTTRFLECPNCGHRQRVLKTSVAYYCESCNEMIQAKLSRKVDDDEPEARDIREWAPYAAITLSYSAAIRHEEKGRIDEAIEIHMKNIKENSSLGISHYERAASLLEEQRRYYEAIWVCKRALEPGAVRFDSSLREQGTEYVQKEFNERLDRLHKKIEK